MKRRGFLGMVATLVTVPVIAQQPSPTDVHYPKPPNQPPPPPREGVQSFLDDRFGRSYASFDNFDRKIRQGELVSFSITHAPPAPSEIRVIPFDGVRSVGVAACVDLFNNHLLVQTSGLGVTHGKVRF